MNFRLRFFQRWAVLSIVIILSACVPGLTGGTPAAGTPQVQGTRRNATPTPNMAGYRISTQAQACSVNAIQTIRTSSFQGSLVAWSPDGKQIAWIEPTEAHLWFAGNLMVASAPGFKEPIRLAQNVTGNLTWSPDGSQIAYSALRPSENLLTIMVVSSAGGQPRDLFPGGDARLDGYSSPKAIIAWSTPNLLRVLAECGSSCIQTLDFDPQSGALRPQDSANPVDPTVVWRPERRERTVTPEAYPEMVEPNWSADSSLVAYFDENGHLWVLEEKEKLGFQISMPNYLPVNLNQPGDRETHWSKNGQLAVRIDDRLEIFTIPCQAE